MLTFLSTARKDMSAERVLARAVPGEALTQTPRRVIQCETMKDADSLLTSTLPLPEDWWLRDLAGAARKLTSVASGAENPMPRIGTRRPRSWTTERPTTTLSTQSSRTKTRSTNARRATVVNPSCVADGYISSGPRSSSAGLSTVSFICLPSKTNVATVHCVSLVATLHEIHSEPCQYIVLAPISQRQRQNLGKDKLTKLGHERLCQAGSLISSTDSCNCS